MNPFLLLIKRLFHIHEYGSWEIVDQEKDYVKNLLYRHHFIQSRICKKCGYVDFSKKTIRF
jgi:hypothetical protein